jgi:hypothetical protein
MGGLPKGYPALALKFLGSRDSGKCELAEAWNFTAFFSRIGSIHPSSSHFYL